eukprot:scaffold3504_cov240-Pinguiococcus_pyrenoidosus.AAC.25
MPLPLGAWMLIARRPQLDAPGSPVGDGRLPVSVGHALPGVSLRNQEASGHHRRARCIRWEVRSLRSCGVCAFLGA